MLYKKPEMLKEFRLTFALENETRSLTLNTKGLRTKEQERERENLGTPREVMVSKFAFKAILMHNPVTFLSFRSPPSVEHQCLLHSHKCTGL